MICPAAVQVCRPMLFILKISMFATVVVLHALNPQFLVCVTDLWDISLS